MYDKKALTNFLLTLVEGQNTVKDKEVTVLDVFVNRLALIEVEANQGFRDVCDFVLTGQILASI